MIRTILITLPLLWHLSLFAQDLPGGLKFYSTHEQDQGYSKLVLPDKGNFSISKPFSISFDIAFDPQSPYGVILQARDGNTAILTLFYIDYQSVDSSILYVIYKEVNTGINIPIKKNELDLNKWLNLKLAIDPLDEAIELTFNGQKRNTKIIMDETWAIHWVFGKPVSRNDVPSMAIRNIKFSISGIETNHWPLDEFQDNEAHDIIGNRNGKQTDCFWLNSRHQKWIQTQSFPMNPKLKFEEFSNQGFNDIIYIGEELLGVKNEKHTIHLQPMEKGSLPKKFSIHFNQIENQVFAFHEGGEGPISRFDSKRKKWINVDSTISNNDFYNGILMIDPENGDLWRLGGYGNYAVKNNLMKYDWKHSKWESVSYNIENGDTFHPRDKMVSAISADSSFYWLFGGEGNESGNQEDGFRFFFELWKFYLGDPKMEKVWDWNGKPELLVVDINVLEDSLLSILTIDKISEQLRFFYSPTTNSEIKELSINLPKSPKGEVTFIMGHDGYSLNVLSANSENENIMVFELALPPVQPMINNKKYPKDNPFTLFLLVGLGISIVSALFYHTFGKPSSAVPEIAQKGIVILFTNGEMELRIDGNPIDLEKVKLKKAVNLLKLIAAAPDQKIQHSEIKENLWPHVMDESFHNSLNVAIHELRNIISPLGDQLINQNKYISLKCEIFGR